MDCNRILLGVPEHLSLSPQARQAGAFRSHLYVGQATHFTQGSDEAIRNLDIADTVHHDADQKKGVSS